MTASTPTLRYRVEERRIPAHDNSHLGHIPEYDMVVATGDDGREIAHAIEDFDQDRPRKFRRWLIGVDSQLANELGQPALSCELVTAPDKERAVAWVQLFAALYTRAAS